MRRYHQFNRLKELREENGLTQDDIANLLECSQRAYSHYESGDREVPLSTMSILASYYGVSLDYILGNENRRNKDDNGEIN